MNAAVSSELITRTKSTIDNPKKAIIGLHGWTGNEDSFEPVSKMINLDNVKWYFPRAPYKSGVGKGYSWFSGSDEKGWDVDKTWNGMHDLLAKIQSDGFKPNEIYLMGFSQGACLAIEFALRLPYAIGGIIPIAGFIKFKEKLLEDRTEESKGTPILLLHGRQDEIIPLTASETAYNILSKLEHPLYFEAYDATHKIPLDIAPMIKDFISDSINFINSNLSKQLVKKD
tara:strand:+ start:1464 stop:2147 length:684 start_codon:yes stop_codon:yes gene_type:complete